MSARGRFAALLAVVAGATANAEESTGTMKGAPVGVPLAHWSEDFSFGIRFSAPVETISRGAIHPPEAILKAVPDNAAGTRWRFRVRPGWSADARIRVGANHAPGFVPLCAANNVCGAGGEALEAAVIVNVPSRPPDRTWVSCEKGSVYAGEPGR